MARGLFGLDALMDGQVARLVGLDREGRRVTPEFRTVPLVQVVGGRGSGKTAVLDRLFRDYNGVLPLARADLGATNLGEDGMRDLLGEETPHASPVTHLLYLLSYKLGLRAYRFSRPLEFPKLSVGLLLATTWRPAEGGAGGGPRRTPDGAAPAGDATDHRLVPADLLAAERRLRAALAEESPDQRRRRELLKQWLDALIANMPGVLPGVPGLDGVVRSVLTTARDHLLAHRTDRGPIRWWGQHLTRFQGDDIQRLFTFVLDFRRLGDRRSLAEALLVTAFLEDIADHYGWLRRTNQAPRPLVLLDNVHTPAGRHVLDLLLRGYERAEGVTRPTIVTTALDDRDGCLALHDIAHRTPWREPGPGGGEGARRRWLLRAALPDARIEDIMGMFGAVDYPAYLPRLIQRLSGGRTGGARLLVDAAVRRLRTGEELPAHQLLDLPAVGRQGTVADQLLAQLLPDPSVRATLTLLSAALDEEATRRLRVFLEQDEPGGPPAAGGRDAEDREDTAITRVREAKDALDEPHWHREPWPAWPGCEADRVPFVADRALRILLLHRLVRGSTADRWSRVHRRLRSGYNPRELDPGSAEHGVPYLHHTLALGELETVVRCLHQHFTVAVPVDWLAGVNVVCAAPHPPAGPRQDPPDGGGASPPCPACTDAEAQRVHRAVGRLVRALWRLSDPAAPQSAPHDTELDIEELTLALGRLYETNDTGGTYLDALRQWPDQLRRGVQAPDLVVRPEGQV